MTYIVWGSRTSIPSYRSRKSADGTGNMTSIGAIVWPVAQLAMLLTLLICVWPWNSPADPATRTTSPRLTLSLLPLKTKIPSDVAGSASPARSWR